MSAEWWMEQNMPKITGMTAIVAANVAEEYSRYYASEVAGGMEKALSEALASAQCMNVHHGPKDMHSGWECPVIARWDAALADFRKAVKP